MWTINKVTENTEAAQKEFEEDTKNRRSKLQIKIDTLLEDIHQHSRSKDYVKAISARKKPEIKIKIEQVQALRRNMLNCQTTTVSKRPSVSGSPQLHSDQSLPSPSSNQQGEL